MIADNVLREDFNKLAQALTNLALLVHDGFQELWRIAEPDQTRTPEPLDG